MSENVTRFETSSAMKEKSFPEESRIRAMIRDDLGHVVRELALSHIDSEGKDVRAINAMIETSDGEYRRILLNEKLELDKSDLNAFREVMDFEISQFRSEEYPGIEQLTRRFQQIPIFHERTDSEVFTYLLQIISENYVRNPLFARDIALSILRAIGKHDSDSAISFFFQLRNNQIDQRGIMTGISISKRLDDPLLTINLAKRVDSREIREYETSTAVKALFRLIMECDEEEYKGVISRMEYLGYEEFGEFGLLGFASNWSSKLSSYIHENLKDSRSEFIGLLELRDFLSSNEGGAQEMQRGFSDFHGYN